MAVALVDFHNFFPDSMGISEVDEFESILRVIVGTLFSEAIPIEEITIRLYGGWYQDGTFTRTADRILQSQAYQKAFPTTHPFTRKLIRGTLELARTLISVPDIPWTRTLVCRQGLPQLRIQKTETEICDQARALCPIKSLRHFAKKKNRECHLQGCSVTNQMAFAVLEQKMVDTMLACDLLAYSEQSTQLFVFSDDVDLLPPLAMAASKSDGAKLNLVHRNSRTVTMYAEILNQLKIRTVKSEY